MNFIAGFFFGGMLSLINFRLLKKLVNRMIIRQNRKDGLFFGMKSLPLLAATAFLLFVVKIDPVAFIAGFGAVLFGVCWKEIKSQPEEI